jgi:hypothetical protein
MLVFDRFPTRERAEAFASAVTERFSKRATVHDTEEEAMRVDLYIWGMEPWIVLVERDDEFRDEDEIVELVRAFGGTYEGT